MLKKILKSNLVTKLLVFLIVQYITLVHKTCRVKINYLGKAKEIVESRKPAIFCCWHSRFMMFFPLPQLHNSQAVTSAHKDGNYLSEILEWYNHTPIRGSSRKKATQAVREILNIDRDKLRLVITPDGPLGPPFKVKGSADQFAKKFNVPVIPMSYSASKAIVLKTWDRFIIPIPFISKIILEFGNPITSKTLSNAKIEQVMIEQTQRLDNQLNLVIN